ncbi:MAG: toll/interleukin-1 receptor domain-containing protein [Candidatus Thiodiazotropha sp.]
MANIFISYRREDSADVTGRIHDRLVEHFGDSALFMDVDDIPLGVDFSKYIDEKVGKCEVVLAVIGRDWLSAADANGNRRLDLPEDFVRIELESALKRNIPVIPLLVRRASMPKAKDLPESIRDFSKRNGMLVRPDPDFRTDCDRLIEGLERDRTGTRPIVSTRKKSVEKKPKSNHKALLIGVLGIALVSALVGLFVWYSGSQSPAPSIVEFQANPNRIDQGATTKLRWVTKNARKVTIHPNIGTVPSSGSKDISPTENTTYTLAARGSDNSSVKQRLSVQVNSRPVASIPKSSLSVEKSTIELGKSTTLRWRTRDATDVEINPGIGRVGTTGSLKISPRRNTTYTLTAKSSSGTATSTALVKVRRPLTPTTPTIVTPPTLILTQ